MIGNVEDLPARLDTIPLLEGEVLKNREIQVREPGTDQDIATSVASKIEALWKNRWDWG